MIIKLRIFFKALLHQIIIFGTVSCFYMNMISFHFTGNLNLLFPFENVMNHFIVVNKGLNNRLCPVRHMAWKGQIILIYNRTDILVSVIENCF